MSLLTTAANAAWFASGAPAYAAFRSALNDPRRAQLELLRRYVRDNATTGFGCEHGFGCIDDLASFRRRIPVRDYDGLAPWIDRIVAGEQRVLTAQRVTRLIPSSGSTRAAKLIPYTAALQREFNRAIGPWIVDLYRRTPDLMRGCAYWSITPVAQSSNHTRSAVPIGFDEDSAYVGGVRKRLVDAVMAVPGDVRYVADVDAFRFATLAHLMRRRDLRLISVWHPSFLELLLDGAADRWEELLEASGRRDIAPRDWRAAWPHLRVVSCWADANAALPADSLGRRLPHIKVQPKGLIATEAFVSLPFADHWPLAIRSHFFEFEDDAGRMFVADELREGGEYGLVVTTAGGLWRYRLGDRVRCDGRLGRTPSIRFVGRNDLVVDRAGEKLSDGFVAGVIRELLAAFDTAANFAMLAPEASTPPCYTLFIEARSPLPANAATRLDSLLCANPHYAYCRALGQLAPARIVPVLDGAYEAYARHRRAAGRRIGDLKPVALDADTGWADLFIPAPPASPQGPPASPTNRPLPHCPQSA